MKRRWSANNWVLTVLLVILALVGIDVGRRMMAGPAATAPPPDPTPKFKVGDAAPAFNLPDGQKKEHRFPEMVKRDTLLLFSCGCSFCREFQVYVAKMGKKLGARTPDIVSVNTTDPVAEEAWLRNTGLKQTMLYGEHKSGDVAVYQGAPCPRAYRVNGERKITFIGKSRAGGTPVALLGTELAVELGFNASNQPQQAGAPKAPEMKWESEASRLDPEAKPVAAEGHGPEDGHDHKPGDGH